MAEEDVKKYTVYIAGIVLIAFIILNIIFKTISYNISSDLFYFLIIITIIPFLLSLINYFRK